jgi:glycosyltransferase involved in cell wall biosynthesis
MTDLIKGKVSVVLTVHNDAAHLLSSVESILNQTYSQFELIVVDDGSTDNSAALVRAISDARVILLQPGRVGRGRSLNAGIARSTGEFIAIQDSDDLSHPQRLEVQTRALTELGIDFLGAAAILFEDDQVPPWPVPGADSTSPVDVTDELRMANPIPHISLMMRHAVIASLGAYDEDRSLLFDYDMFIRAATEGYRLYRLPVSLAAKRIHSRQHFEAGARARYVIEMLKLQRKAIDGLKGKRWLLATFPLLFCYRMLPREFRMSVQKRRSLYNAS